MATIRLDGESLSLDLLRDIAVTARPVALSPQAIRRMRASRSLVDSWVSRGETIYGVTTGFGEFASTRIETKDIERLQENLIRSHAVGYGPPIPPEVVRAMMALRINALARGHSGIRVETVQTLVSMLNANVVPVIPSQGSVGASGDLVQLSHLVLAMTGTGSVWANGSGRQVEARSALRKAGIRPVKLTAKEGLALINGTQMMTAYTALAAERALRLAQHADIIASVSVEALRGSDTAFDARIHALRPYRGQQTVARNLRKMMRKSRLRESHRYGDTRVQDAYSLRCIPQVHGASRDALTYVLGVLDIEMNSVNDNPLLFPEDGVHLEGGNFHGQPIALAADFLAIAVSELANISERRTERLVNGSLSGLPKFLTRKGGLHSGMMIAQYTAASLVSENKVLAHPASVDSIPTSANQEDHNSMGSIAAQKVWRVVENAEAVLAIEYMCACQALDFARVTGTKRRLAAGAGTEAAYRVLRSAVRGLGDDRVLHADVQKAVTVIRSGKVQRAVEKVVGKVQ